MSRTYERVFGQVESVAVAVRKKHSNQIYEEAKAIVLVQLDIAVVLLSEALDRIEKRRQQWK